VLEAQLKAQKVRQVLKKPVKEHREANQVSQSHASLVVQARLVQAKLSPRKNNQRKVQLKVPRSKEKAPTQEKNHRVAKDHIVLSGEKELPINRRVRPNQHQEEARQKEAVVHPRVEGNQDPKIKARQEESRIREEKKGSKRSESRSKQSPEKKRGKSSSDKEQKKSDERKSSKKETSMVKRTRTIRDTIESSKKIVKGLRGRSRTRSTDKKRK